MITPSSMPFTVWTAVAAAAEASWAFRVAAALLPSCPIARMIPATPNIQSAR